MNYHYIDYMIRERRREELEACERQRLLHAAGYSQAPLRGKLWSGLIHAVRRLRKPWTYSPRQLQLRIPMINVVARMKEEGQ